MKQNELILFCMTITIIIIIFFTLIINSGLILQCFETNSNCEKLDSDREKVFSQVNIEKTNDESVLINYWKSRNVDEVQIYVNGDYKKTLTIENKSKTRLSISEGDVIQEFWVIEEDKESTKFKYKEVVYKEGKLEEEYYRPSWIIQDYHITPI